ncbi:DUF3093 domain-containing protein [Amycolatopsis nigrescens]|uniref:DUF3093 domain-containing protein n=1 Tax=Amycolatopsis nigrescens TaxID=381445 RepID=UPI0009FBF533|nr:DUF3093 domain-containing protein [Amycolatopsis nigrescens]
MGNSTSAADAQPDSGRKPGKPSGKGGSRHSERLYLSWWGWPGPLIAAGLLAAEIHMGYPGVRAWLPYVLLVPLTAALMVALGRIKVRVTGSGDTGHDAEAAENTEDAELWVGDAHLPLRHIGAIEVIGAKQKRKALGPDLDPAAFVVHRGWVGPLLRVHLTDPEDPTPYWLFSTRKPEKVAELLSGGRPDRVSTAGQPPPETQN